MEPPAARPGAGHQSAGEERSTSGADTPARGRRREQFGAQLSRSRSAGRKGGRPRWLHRQSSSGRRSGWTGGGPSRSCSGGARRLAGAKHQEGGRVWNWGGRPWRTGGRLFTAAGSRAATPALQDGGCRRRRGDERARVGAVRRAACAEPICGAGGWQATRASPPMERVRLRTELHRAGHGGWQGKNIKRAGGCGIGVGVPGGPEAGCSGRRLQGGHPCLAGWRVPVDDEEMIERGREQFGEQLARSRSAGREAGRPRGLHRRWSEYGGAARSLHRAGHGGWQARAGGRVSCPVRSAGGTRDEVDAPCGPRGEVAVPQRPELERWSLRQLDGGSCRPPRHGGSL